MLNDALKLAKLGIHVFPLSPYSKIPIKGTSGVKDATIDPDQIRRWWREIPDANIGIAMGKISGIVGVDFDCNHGAKPEYLPLFQRTVTQRTKNGFHLFYKCPPTGIKGHTIVRSADPNDPAGAATLRSDGQYFVASPSVVRHDDRAEWEYSYLSEPGGQELAFGEIVPLELPDFLVSGEYGSFEDMAASKVRTGPRRNSGKYSKGSRHDMFVRTASGMWADGATIGQIRKELYRRNEADCDPPKTLEEMETEAEGILRWLPANVEKKESPSSVSSMPAKDSSGPPPAASTTTEAAPQSEEYIIPLGYRGQDYYYTSSGNKNVLRLSGSSHTSGGLQQLMPPAYWKAAYPTKQGGVDWTTAGGELMAACRAVGYFDEDRVRGPGRWLSEAGDLILHQGDELLVNGVRYELNGLSDGYIYQLGAHAALHPSPLTLSECSILVNACSAPRWRNDGYGKLLAGGIAVLRLCGALRWRPMFWLTGASGSGKSTVMERIVRPMMSSDAAYFQGAATEAGIRQELKCGSRPVIFDEAETNNEESSKRIQRIIQLARQGSSMSGGKIVKGTPSGQALSFTVNSSFLLASIRVNLVEEADINRFTILELDRPDPAAWPAIAKAMDGIDEEYGERLFSHMVRRWDELERARLVFEDAIVANGEDRRRAQQYSIILAGYWLLTSDELPQMDAAKALAHDVVGHQRAQMEEDSDERQCLDRLLAHQVRLADEITTIDQMIKSTVSGNTAYSITLAQYGLAVHGNMLYVESGPNSELLSAIYRGTKWTGMWAKALDRFPGTVRGRLVILNRHPRTVAIPLAVVYH